MTRRDHIRGLLEELMAQSAFAAVDCFDEDDDVRGNGYACLTRHLAPAYEALCLDPALIPLSVPD